LSVFPPACFQTIIIFFPLWQPIPKAYALAYSSSV
jgi:hypothetical protein